MRLLINVVVVTIAITIVGNGAELESSVGYPIGI